MASDGGNLVKEVHDQPVGCNSGDGRISASNNDEEIDHECDTEQSDAMLFHQDMENMEVTEEAIRDSNTNDPPTPLISCIGEASHKRAVYNPDTKDMRIS